MKILLAIKLVSSLLGQRPKREITYHHADGGPGEDIAQEVQPEDYSRKSDARGAEHER
jgi:hypothetical protein